MTAVLLDEIKAERKRQIDVEGYTHEHDDTQHRDGDLLRAANLYYLHTEYSEQMSYRNGVPVGWPWDAVCWKPKDNRRNLIRAGALCVAERDRLRRAHGSAEHVNQKLSRIVQALEKLDKEAKKA